MSTENSASEPSGVPRGDNTKEKPQETPDTVDVEQQNSSPIIQDENVSGTNKIEAIQAVWGKHGKLLVILAYVVVSNWGI